MPRQFIDADMAVQQQGIWVNLDCVETDLQHLIDYAKDRHAHVMPPVNAETDWYEQEEAYISMLEGALKSVRSVMDSMVEA